MGILYVGDNRSNLNWGRAASIALHELLSQSFEIVDSVRGDLFDLQTADVGYVHTLMPRKHYPIFRALLKRRGNVIVRAYLRLERLLGARDFIHEDPEISVKEICANSAHYPELKRIKDAAQSADAIVVDGDGDLQFSEVPRRQTSFVLAMIALGLHYKKPVFLINAMVSPPSSTGRGPTTFQYARKLISQCKVVALRDPLSFGFAKKEFHGPAICYFPDSLFAWCRVITAGRMSVPANSRFVLPYPEEHLSGGQVDFSQPYICVGGGAVSASSPESAVKAYSKLVQAILDMDIQVCLVESDSPDGYLRTVAANLRLGIVPARTSAFMSAAILGNARAFVSGRYHPSIMASLGGTPCIFLGSHGHKMESLAKVLDYQSPVTFSACPTDREIQNIVQLLRDYLKRGDTLREEIRQAADKRCGEAEGLPRFLADHLYPGPCTEDQTVARQ